jgi:hypothetical protein
MPWFLRIILLFAALSGALAGPGDATLYFYRVSAQGCDFFFSSAYEKNVREHERAFQESVKRLSLYLEELALPGRCRIFFVVNSFELRTLLEEKYGLDAPGADQSVKSGVFRRGLDAVVLVGKAGLDWSSRIFLIEYTRLALGRLLAEAGDARAAWFTEGFAVCLSWYAANPEELSVIEKYYGAFFDARRVKPLGELFRESAYRRAEQLHGTHALAQAVLAAYYFARKTRDFRRGLLVLKLYMKEKNFQTAFQRAAGITLERFEDEVVKLYFPLFRNSVWVPVRQFGKRQSGHAWRACDRAHGQRGIGPYWQADLA